MNYGITIKAAETVLSRMERPRVWMTARGMAHRIRILARDEYGFRKLVGLSQVDLFNKLVEHASREVGDRVIRNSRFPSFHTLEDLWGAIATVGDRDVLPPMLLLSTTDRPRTDSELSITVDDFDPNREVEEQAAYFMSYNHCDEAAALAIVSELEKKGHSVWIAGSRIAEGEYISQRVRRAIQAAKGTILYLSEKSLQSRWVAKEAIVSEALSLDEPLKIIVKSDDADLIALVSYWLHSATENCDETESRVPLELSTSNQAAVKFRNILKREVHETDNKIYLYPDYSCADGSRLFGLSDFPDIHF